MKINIGEIEVNYELTEDEKKRLDERQQKVFKFLKEKAIIKEKINKIFEDKIDQIVDKPKDIRMKIPPKGWYNATIIGDLFDTSCSKIGFVANTIGIKKTSDCIEINSISGGSKDSIYVQYFYNSSAILKIGKELGYFKKIEPDIESLETIMEFLSKIRYNGYKPTKKIAEVLDKWNDKYLTK